MKMTMLFLVIIIMQLMSHAQTAEWNKVSTTIDFDTKSFSFVNDSVGYILNRKHVSKTTNGGIDIDIKAQVQRQYIYFYSENSGWISGFGNAKKTTDGGASWQDESWLCDGLVFIDSLRGFCFNNGNVLRTIDGGVTFQNTPAIPDYFISDLYFLNDQYGWLCTTNDHVMRTTDFGQNWQLVDSISVQKNGALKHIIFLDSLNGFMITYMGDIFKTTDSGFNWQKKYSSSFYSTESITKKPNNELWVCGTNGLLLKSSDLGNTWTPQISGVSTTINKIQFSSNNVGYFGCQDGIFKSIDGGINWSKLVQSENKNFTAISNSYNDFMFANDCGEVSAYTGIMSKKQLPDSAKVNDIKYYLTSSLWPNYTRVWMVDDIGNIYHVDGLQNVTISHSETGTSLKAIYSTTHDYVWCVGRNGKILHTNNQGTSWSTQNSNTSETLNDVFFTDSLNGYIVGNNGVFLKTTDGGSNWNIINLDISEKLNSIFFYNNQIGWIVGDNGIILKTTDAGITWFTQSSGTNKNLNGLGIVSLNEVYIVGNDGLILNTNNSGINWYVNNSNTTSNLNDINAFNQSHVYICGDNGIILKKTSSPTIPFYELSGTLYISNSQQTISNAELWLYKYDTLDFTIASPIDFIQSNSIGKFTFQNVENGHYSILAIPDSTTHPHLVPTFYGNVFEWFNAEKIIVNNGNVTFLNIRVFDTDTTSGSMLVSGNAYYGTIQNENPNNDDNIQKRSAVPAENQLLILYNKNNNKPVSITRSDVDGNFQFKVNTEGEYGIHIDLFSVGIDTAFSIELNNNLPNYSGIKVFIDSSGIMFENPLSIKSHSKNNQSYSLFPNPTNNNLIIHSNTEEEYELSIFSIEGKIHYSTKLYGNQKINLEELSSGLYLFRIIKSNGYSEHIKVLKN